jgi:hypothetical protein
LGRIRAPLPVEQRECLAPLGEGAQPGDGTGTRIT